MANIREIEGIGDASADKLEAAGIKTIEAFLEAGATVKGRDDLAEKTGLAEKNILKWVNRADLDRVKGIGTQYADLLEAAGVDSAPELAQRNAANLLAKMDEVNASKNLVNKLPSEDQVQGWIDNAKTLPKIVSH